MHNNQTPSILSGSLLAALLKSNTERKQHRKIPMTKILLITLYINLQFFKAKISIFFDYKKILYKI